MITVVNFANQKFRKKQKWNSITAKFFGKANNVLEYGIKDLEIEYLSSNREVLKYAKGFGNYFWKPYIINKALEQINEGDYLLYADSGSIFLKSIIPIAKHLEKNNKNILCFKLPLIEKQWTKRDTFILMECDTEFFTESNHLMATFLMIRKSKESKIFLEDFQKFCSDERILSDNPNVLGKPNYPEFIEHRHDQSVLSLLAKKHQNVLIEGDISDYGYFPQGYLKNTTRLYDKNALNPKDYIFKGTVLCNRTTHPLIYAIKYFIKLSMFKIFGFEI